MPRVSRRRFPASVARFLSFMEDGFDVGVFGLDLLCSNLARSMATQGVSVTASPGPGVGAENLKDRAKLRIKIAPDIEELTSSLKSPRVLIVRAAAGTPAQTVFNEALTALDSDDVIVDSSDSWFRDTSLRAQAAAGKGIHYLALGLARNETGPQPLLLPGGIPEVYARVARFFGLTAPINVLGNGAAGHFIKMTHAAVENAFAEIVRETLMLLERGLGAEAGDLLRVNHEDPLFECLRLKTAPAPTEASHEPGHWAVRAARELEIPTLTLEAACGERSWENREALAAPFCQPHGVRRTDGKSLVAQAHGAIRVATILAYTEGLSLLATASDRFALHIDLCETLRIWRSGATLRGRLLEEILAAFEMTPGLPNLLFDEDFSGKVMERQELLRHAVWQADEWNIATPALAAALRSIDTFRGAWMPINLVQPHNFQWTPRTQFAAVPPADWEAQERFIGHPLA